MTREDVIVGIRSKEAAIRALGVRALYLYGSHARNEARPDSDVDVFVDRAANGNLGLLELARLKQLLEDALKSEVDVGTRRGLHPVLKSAIESNAIQVF